MPIFFSMWRFHFLFAIIWRFVMFTYDSFSTPKPLSDAVEILGTSSCIFGLFVFLVHWVMVWTIPTFKLQSHQQRVYTAKNMAKSIVLAGLMPLSYKILIDFFLLGEMDPTDVRLAGTVYASTDIAGLFIVTNHSKTTLFHHLTVTAMALYNLMYTLERIWSGFAVYGAFCSFTFLVNTTLALKWILDLPMLRNFCTISFLTYASACLLNWVTQLYFIRNYFKFEFESYLFVTLMFFILVDDLVLMDWLLRKSTKKTALKMN